MKILFIPTTEGYGHVARAKAIIRELEKYDIDYSVLTDEKRALFLQHNNINQTKINPHLYGIKFVYKKQGNEVNINIPFTAGKLLVDSPRYLIDYIKVLSKTYKEKYDLIINDINLQVTRIPFANVMNIVHYTLPKSSDVKKLLHSPHSFTYQGIIEPMINIPLFGTKKFIMDFRPSYIDYEHIFPPIVSRLTKRKEDIRKEFDLKRQDRFVVDGRAHPPIETYERMAQEHPEIKFLIRHHYSSHDHIYTRPFIPDLINYVNAADVFVTNPGFSSIGEGVVSGTPMIIDHPGNHLEQIKNLIIAIDEGFGRAMTSIEHDIFNTIDDHQKQKQLPNGLTYLCQKILNLHT